MRISDWSSDVCSSDLDHIDGLFDPQQYCARLQAHAGALSGGTPYYILVEKILAAHESLPEDWPVAGTTGYDFLNVLNGLFVDPDGERPLTRFYARFIEEPTGFGEMLYECKKHVMDNALASELNVLANELNRISDMNWQTRDYTRNGLRSEEHTSELQSLMRISYAVFCLK